MNMSTFCTIKYMNRSYFSKARYMIGVGFKILGRTPVPKLPPSYPPPPPPPPEVRTTTMRWINCVLTIYVFREIYFSSKNIKMSSFKSSENIQKKEDRSASDNQSSSMTLIELAMKARNNTVISSFRKEVIHLGLALI